MKCREATKLVRVIEARMTISFPYLIIKMIGFNKSIRSASSFVHLKSSEFTLL